MGQYISKSALVEEGQDSERIAILDIIDTLAVKEINPIVNPYYACVQYTDRESAIKAHAVDYSWNIESELFQQLTPEQQKLWRKEIEQACISGGYSGLNLAKDPRYKENLEVKKVDNLPQVWDRETLDEYAYQVAYDLSHDWMRETPTWDDVQTAVKLGAKWQRELLDKALDFIVETQEQNDYICEQMEEELVGDYCEKNCHNLNKDCVKMFLQKVYGKEGSI